MASKKCPKCGEDNPAEAVMCWACYTPLSGQAPLGAGLAGAAAAAIPKTAGAPVGVPQSNEPAAKKPLDPKVIGVGAVLLLGLGAVVMMSGVLGGSGDAAPIANTDPAVSPDPGPGPMPGGGGVPAPVLVPGGGGGGGAAPAAVPAPFDVVSPPGRFKTGTVGIMVRGTASPAGAAKFAKNQFARNGNWTNMQIVAFTDRNAASAFAEYQRGRQNEPLTAGDFKRLADSGVWNNTPAYLDSRGGKDTIYYPFQRPQSWWPR